MDNILVERREEKRREEKRREEKRRMLLSALFEWWRCLLLLSATYSKHTVMN